MWPAPSVWPGPTRRAAPVHPGPLHSLRSRVRGDRAVFIAGFVGPVLRDINHNQGDEDEYETRIPQSRPGAELLRLQRQGRRQRG